MRRYFVQLGPFAQVGCMDSDAGLFRRGDRVVCRTARGLELGEVLSVDEGDEPGGDGVVLRTMSDTDYLLQTRIEQRRDRAIAACEQEIQRLGISVSLVDVEHLFDGGSLYFYFLGDPDPRLAEITERLAETYEAKVNFRRFTERLATGCGPGCGTESKAGGCGTGGCSTCSLSGGCAVGGRGR